MACGANGNALRHLVLDAADSANGGGCDGARNSRDDNRNNSDGRNASNLFRNDGAHGDRDGFGEERTHENVA